MEISLNKAVNKNWDQQVVRSHQNTFDSTERLQASAAEIRETQQTATVGWGPIKRELWLQNKQIKGQRQECSNLIDRTS